VVDARRVDGKVCQIVGRETAKLRGTTRWELNNPTRYFAHWDSHWTKDNDTQNINVKNVNLLTAYGNTTSHCWSLL